MTAPASPSTQVTPDDATGSILLTVTNPAPESGEPVVTSVDVWRRETAAGGAGIRLVAGLEPDKMPFVDWTPASGVDYQYRATAHASSNGTSTVGPWNGGPTSGSTSDVFADVFRDTF